MKTRTLLTLFISLWWTSPIFAGLPSDAEATRLLSGDWNKQGSQCHTKFRPDGTFSGNSKYKKMAIKVEGKWRIERGVLIEEITRSTDPAIIPTGHTTRDTLTSITKKEFRYRADDGNERTYIREEDTTNTQPK